MRKISKKLLEKPGIFPKGGEDPFLFFGMEIPIKHGSFSFLCRPLAHHLKDFLSEQEATTFFMNSRRKKFERRWKESDKEIMKKKFNGALYNDLKKSKKETWATETVLLRSK